MLGRSILRKNRFRTIAWLMFWPVLFTVFFFHPAAVTAQDDELSIKLRMGTIVPGEEAVQSAAIQGLTIIRIRAQGKKATISSNSAAPSNRRGKIR